MKSRDNHEDQLKLASDQLERGLLREAINTYRRLAMSKPSIEACLGICYVLEKAGKRLMDRKIAAILAAKYPNDHRPLLQLAKSSIAEGDYSTGWRHIQACLTANPQCREGWEQAYTCASKLGNHKLCEQIARKLLDFDSSSSRYFDLLAASLTEQHKPIEACRAYRAAHSLAPSDIVYFINSQLPFYRVFPAGITPCEIRSRIASTSEAIQQWLQSGKTWEFRSDRGLVNSIFYIAYTPFNLNSIYRPYFSALSLITQPLVSAAISRSNEMAARLKPVAQYSDNESGLQASQGNPRIRLGITSSHFYSHSNSLAFEGFLKYLNKGLFCIILIHGSETVCDSKHAALNDLADEVVYLSKSLPDIHLVLTSLNLDILFFTDIGMSPFDFIVPALRACEIQITGWGLPHTTGLNTIDYYLSSSLLESEEHVDEYTEKLVLLNGLPCCFLSESLHYQKRPKQYFMFPDNRVIIGCVQSLFKIHPDMDLILESIAKRLPDAIFAFVTFSESLDSAFLSRLSKRAPNAFNQTILVSRCSTTDYLALCDCLDIILDTPYYGAGITAYMSTYVGTPMVCFSGNRLRDSTTSAIYRYLSIDNAPIVNSFSEYVDEVIKLANSFELRLQIKKDTVEAAHKLYDNQEYIRSFERFCIEIIADT